MKRVILSMTFLSLTCLSIAQEKGIRFQQTMSWKQIKEKARKENKFIFVDVYATWCAPCKEMDKNVYTSEQVGSFINDKFISAKVQIDKTETDDQNIKAWYADAKQIRAEYEINSFPTILFFSPDGNLVQRAGFVTAESLVRIAGETIDLSKQYNSQLKKYKNHELSVSEMKELALSAKKAGDMKTSQRIADDYINNYLFKKNENELFTKENLQFIGKFMGTPDSKAFQLFIKQWEKINEVLGEYEAEKAVIIFIDKKYLPQQDSWTITKPDWDAVEKNVIAKFGDLGREAVWGERMIYHLVLKDNWNNYAKYFTLYFQKAYKHPIWYINNMCWAIFENVSDPEVLTFACDTVMKYAMETWYQNDGLAYDTYANLLYKTGKKDQAIEWQEKAVKLLPNDKNLIGALDKMKNGIPTWNVSNSKL